jgi:hypothetical protein
MGQDGITACTVIDDAFDIAFVLKKFMIVLTASRLNISTILVIQ